jgi:hypothetical protein
MDRVQDVSRRDGRVACSMRHGALVLALALSSTSVDARPAPSRSGPPRLAFLQLKSGPIPLLLVGPRTALLAFPETAVGGSELGRRFEVCAADGSRCVETGGWQPCGPDECAVDGQLLNLVRPIAAIHELVSPEAIRAELDALPEISAAAISSSQIRESRQMSPAMVAEIKENARLMRSLDPPHPVGPTALPPIIRSAPPPRTVTWWDGGRVRWELGASGLVTYATGTEATSNWSGGVRVGVGLRFHRPPDSWRQGSIVSGLLEGTKDAVLGKELTVDLRVHMLGSFDASQAWAVGVAIGTVLPLPANGSGAVAGRLSSVLSLFIPEIAVGSWREQYGLGLMWEWRGSLLVRSSFGLTASLGGGTLLTEDRLSFVLAGIGGFVR